METKIIAFDVDGTLITFEDRPRWDIIEMLKTLNKLGCYIIVWSGGGDDYARHWCEKLFIEEYVDDYRNKIHDSEEETIIPDICFDDEEDNLGKVNIQV